MYIHTANHIEAIEAQNQTQDAFASMAAQQAKKLDESLSIIVSSICIPILYLYMMHMNEICTWN